MHAVNNLTQIKTEIFIADPRIVIKLTTILVVVKEFLFVPAHSLLEAYYDNVTAIVCGYKYLNWVTLYQ